jgi:hypothetical protein
MEPADLTSNRFVLLFGRRTLLDVDRESRVLAGVREVQSLDQLARSTELTTELVRMMLERRRRRLGREQEQIDAALKSNLETEGE